MELIFTSKVYGTHKAYLDDVDYHYIKEYNWYLAKGHKTFYLRCPKQIKYKKTTLHLHRLILNVKNGEIPDHIDGNGLNNRRSNLRIATNAQNVWNKKINCNNKLGIKGVHLHGCGRYRVCIFKDGKQIQGGYFEDKIEAAKKYNELAIKHFGEFAKLNTIPNVKTVPYN